MKIVNALLVMLCLALAPTIAAAACTLVPFRVLSDASGQYPSFVRNASQCVNQNTLAANTAENIAVPAGARIVLLSADCNYYSNPYSTAAISGSDVADGTASEQNTAAYAIDSAMANISVIAASTCKITSSWYR